MFAGDSMMKTACSLVLFAATHASADEMLPRWTAEAARVQIVRDNWGIAHVHGRTDADTVFGAIYAQCEDDFRRVESNYLTALGMTAEAEGEAHVWQDLRQRLFVDPDVLKADYAKSPGWLKKLMNAWADGINFYLATHPNAKPRVILHYAPWMALAFTEGSTGGDIERTGPDCCLPHVRLTGRANGYSLSGRDLRHSRDVDGGGH